MLKKSATFICIFATLLLNAFAQAPQLISYQGVARDNSGNILASQPISLSLSLHQTTPNGTVRWNATYDVTTNQFGLFSVEIGAGNLVSGSMNIDWSNGPYFLETAMDASGGSNYLSLGTQQLLSVPYALHSGSSADNQWTKNGDDIYNRNVGSVGINEVLPYASLHVSRAIADSETPVSLQENTGILVLGPIEDNIVFDYRGIQARHGEYVPSLTLSASDLNIQPLGGNVIFHSDLSGDLGKVLITEGGKVGIGVSQPNAMLHVKETNSEAFANIAAYISNQASTTSTSADDHRIGLKIENTGSWGGNAASKDIGLYIANISGQSSANTNIAAVLNGNVLIGDLGVSNVIGNNGNRVLAIQNGSAPSTLSGSGLQIYSADIERPGLPAISSAFHLMTGDGNIIKLYKEQALPATDATPLGSSYGINEINVINNMRDRIDALELRLQALGLLVD